MRRKGQQRKETGSREREEERAQEQKKSREKQPQQDWCVSISDARYCSQYHLHLFNTELALRVYKWCSSSPHGICNPSEKSIIKYIIMIKYNKCQGKYKGLECVSSRLPPYLFSRATVGSMKSHCLKGSALFSVLFRGRQTILSMVKDCILSPA